MLKGLSRLWWSGVKQIRKAQKSQNKKLAKSLLAKPKPAAKRVSRTRPPVARALPALAHRPPGKWLASYFSSFELDGFLPARRMRYWLYLPASAAASPLPLVVMLHGCEQTATEFAQGTRMNLLAERKGFAVLYPQQSVNAHPNRCWAWYKSEIQNGGGDVKMIAAMIEKVVQKHALNASRVYVCGLSAGAAMANILALNYPHLVAAVGMHSGPVFGAAHSRIGAYAAMQHGGIDLFDHAIRNVIKKDKTFPRMPAILIHGLQDTVVRPVNLAQLTHQFKVLNQLAEDGAEPILLKEEKPAGVAARRKSYRMDAYYGGEKMMLKVCEIFNLDHAWSGGDCTLPYNACKGPDASKMMWDFFARHQRSEVIRANNSAD